MAFDLHKVLKYLYDKNSSSFENISYIIKQNLTDGREDVFITFDMLVDEDIIMVMPRSKEHKDHYYKLGCPNFESGEINTLDNFPLMVKMTTTGREFYQRTYLEFDRDKVQQGINRIVKYTFGVVFVGVILQIAYIIVSTVEAEKSLRQTRELHQQEHSAPPPVVKIYLHDSVQKLDSVK